MVEGKINIKIDNMEIRYEGSEDYIKNDLLDTVEKVKDMFDIEQISQTSTQTKIQDQTSNQTKKIRGTITNIAQKLNVESGPDLILAAAIYLQLIEGIEEFTRKQILNKMKEAKGYYKTSHRSNLSTYLNNLTKDDLIELRPDVYTLSAKTKEEMESKLAC